MADNNHRWLIPGFVLHPLFLVCLAIFTAVESTETAGMHIPVFHWYANDLAAMPIILFLSTYLESLIKREQQVYDKYKVISAVIMVSVAFELILPAFSDKYTADLMDIAMYSTGAVCYLKFTN